jgi:hypothetical protein
MSEAVVTETKIKCQVTKNLGRYNWAGTEKEWFVQVLLPDSKWLSASWPEDDEPEIDGVPPSRVIEMIEARERSYWINTALQGKLDLIADATPFLERMDDAWAKSRIATLERQIASLRADIVETSSYLTEAA